ncbi:Cyclic pyranopterin monophosphate synthase [Bythopirellula goksoeyrii]|uniref:GTP 3',8-cyclase n=2 Tax=Bythopirellula goksoeyrii TaxID=1400387 RepID=A0A5B9Q6J2_9BACT|nr:Cyclic pyranopterin monophosphate synthase [Bythopirellula goksoeyrii]
MSSVGQPLTDTLGRVHTSLRVSVTDRCNIRCFYCMPLENVNFRPRDELLTFEEIERFVRIGVTLGIRKIRLTGGEPLVRSELPQLVERLASIDGIEDLALTTNGILLTEQAADLQAAGLQRLNVSLDSLSEETFQKISRRSGLQRVLDGIFAARVAGFTDIRLNAIAIRGLTETEIVPLAGFARTHDFELRFIEFMPLDAENHWESEQVLTSQEIRQTLEANFCPLVPSSRHDPSQPAVDFHFSDGCGRIGFINPISQPFCSSCNRLRITAEGQVRNCLFSTKEWDVRTLLREGGSDDQVRELVRDCVLHKKPAHGVGGAEFVKPERAMYQIGG